MGRWRRVKFSTHLAILAHFAYFCADALGPHKPANGEQCKGLCPDKGATPRRTTEHNNRLNRLDRTMTYRFCWHTPEAP